MPTLSNGSMLTVWEDEHPSNNSPDAVIFSIAEIDGDVVGPMGVVPDFPYGGVDVASVNVFDGFFTVTAFTNDGRTEIFTTLQTYVYDNEGRYIRSLSEQSAYLSTEVISVAASSPDDITVTWRGANEYFGGENTQYGQHQIVLQGGTIQPDTFVNHAPTVTDLNFTLTPGQSLDDVKFSAADADYDLLSFVVVDGPDHGTLTQETRYDPGYYPFHQGHYFDSYHHHQAYLSGNYFDYVPQAGFTGTDTFTVYATDGQGNSRLATITVTVALPRESITLSDARNVVSYADYDHAVLVAALGGADRVAGSRFDDLLAGGTGNDSLCGGAGGDELRGDAGTDRLWGGSGDDVIGGGTGWDWLWGGSGNDRFVFDAVVGRANEDRILDFRSGSDQLVLDSAFFIGLAAGPLAAGAFAVGTAATDADDRIIYHRASGHLLFDADGAGGAAALGFAGVMPFTALSADDFRIV